MPRHSLYGVRIEPERWGSGSTLVEKEADAFLFLLAGPSMVGDHLWRCEGFVC